MDNREIPAAFTQLARLVTEAPTGVAAHRALVDAASAIITGCDHVGLTMLLPDGTFTSLATTDPVVDSTDALQRELGEGPCLEASTELQLTCDDDLTENPTWPRFAERVVAMTPIRAALACPLVLDGRRTGALNVFADSPKAFSDDDLANAAMLAAFGSMAASYALEKRTIEQLREALDSNRMIGAAVGILMATHHVDQQQAFDILSAASQRSNRKLRELASDIVTGPTAG